MTSVGLNGIFHRADMIPVANPLGFYRQCSGQKAVGAIAEQVPGLNTGDRTLVGLQLLRI